MGRRGAEAQSIEVMLVLDPLDLEQSQLSVTFGQELCPLDPKVAETSQCVWGHMIRGQEGRVAGTEREVFPISCPGLASTWMLALDFLASRVGNVMVPSQKSWIEEPRGSDGQKDLGREFPASAS